MAELELAEHRLVAFLQRLLNGGEKRPGAQQPRASAPTSKAVVLAIDQGTTGTTVLVFDQTATSAAATTPRSRQHYPRARLGRARSRRDLGEQPSGRSPGPWTAAGDRTPGTSTPSASPTSARRRSCGTARPAPPVHRPSSGRTGERRQPARSCARRGLEELVRDKTGLVIDPYFSATKIEWLLDSRRRADGRGPSGARSPSAPSTPGSSGSSPAGAVHATDHSNASRTMLYNIRRLDWDDELLASFDIPRAILPEVRPSSGMLRQHPARETSSAPPCPSPASPATSRRRSSARPATARAWPRTPMAPARSC